ncbi:MAG: hypothetical protein JWP29_2195 [Rhodoferax sp.]|nr:hypothetical protein [Rhodoferax sp.]
MEIEFKFAVPPKRLKAVEAEIRNGECRHIALKARYFDTVDGRLAAHGVALRLRLEGSHWVQTVKAIVDGQGPLHRLEHNVDIDTSADGATPPVPDARRHRGTPVGRLLDQLLGRGKHAAPLVQTMATDIARLLRHVRVGGSTVELALDVGQVMGGAEESGDGGAPRVSPVCELELELVDGEVADLVALSAGWAQRHGLWFSTVSKAERGLRLALPPDASHAVKATPPHYGDAKPAALSGLGIQRAVVAACLAQVLPNASEVASGNEEAEVVHQLRVGIRRLRSALRELDGLTPAAFDPAWQTALTDVFRVLGVRRDGELLRTALAERLQAAGAPAVDLPPEVVTPAALGKAVRAPAFQATLVALIGFTAVDAEESARPDAAPRDLLRQRLRKLHRQVLRGGRHFESLSSEDQHSVRKRLKRLRYLVEFAGPLFDAKQAARYADQLEPAQDALGAFNDDAVALRAYREAAEQAPQAWFAVGWLSARQAAQAVACRKVLRRLEKLPRFWKGD